MRGELENKLPIICKFDKKKRLQFEEYFSTAPDWVIEACSILHLKKDAILVRENDEADSIYFVGSGFVRAVDFRVYGIAYDFMRFDDVYAFGGVEVFTKDKFYKTTLQIGVDSIVIKLPRKIFERWIEIDVRVLRIEAENVSTYLLEQARKSRACLFLQGSDRLAFILLDMYERYQQNGLFNIKIQQTELAELSGVSTKTVYRSLKLFQDNDWIIRDGTRISMNEQQYHRLELYLEKIVFR